MNDTERWNPPPPWPCCLMCIQRRLRLELYTFRFDFARDTYAESVVSQFGLVCSRDRLVTVSQSVYMAGIMVGEITFGVVSDLIGRSAFSTFHTTLSVKKNPSVCLLLL